MSSLSDDVVRARRLTAEVWIVLGLSLGQSGVYALMRIFVRLTDTTPLGEQSTALNSSLSERPYVDLIYQLLEIGFALVPVALALYLLADSGKAAVRRIGFTFARPGRDLAAGVGLAALIGLPGIAFYLAGRALGITVSINPAALNDYWWSIPILILAAVKNAVLEEVLVVGYLLERLKELSWRWPAATLASAALRGSYHLYQGIGPFFGNLVMGLVLNEYYRRRGRTMPLVVAHTLLDVVSFVGYWLLPETWRALL